MSEAALSRLVADIGGTHARFLAVGGEADGRRFDCSPRDVADFHTAVSAAIAVTNAVPGEAVIAIAGPVTEGRGRLTNGTWHFDEAELAARFGLARARLVNDFEAVAMALPHLAPDDTLPLGQGDTVHAGSPLIAIGPGTGLGVALLVRHGGRNIAVPTEGGHAGLPVDDPDLLTRLRSVVPVGPLEAETVLSGPGLVRLDRALHGRKIAGEEITSRAMAGEPQSLATVRTFTDLLARFAASCVLVGGAFGGVYFAGGFVAGWLPLIDPGSFRAAFEAGVMAPLLRTVPTMVITRPDPALLGLARYSF